MLRKRSNRLLHKSISITIAFGAIVMLLSFSSCGGKKNALGDAITERDSLPVKLIGNVDIQNRKGERFNTELLYWNESTQKVYSDKFIRIQQPDRVITGHGFDSNQQMTVYVIQNIEGIFYVDENEGTAQPEVKTLPPDSTKKDSVK